MTDSSSYCGGSSSGNNGPTSTDVCEPSGLAYDSAHQLLFVADDLSNRVLVYDLSSGISDGMPASHVLGQSDFNGNGSATSATGENSPAGISYDQANARLFVAEYGNNRVLVYDLSGGVTDGMAAAAEIGQADFISSDCSGGQNGLCAPESVLYDPTVDAIFVGDYYNNRILEYNLGFLKGTVAGGTVGASYNSGLLGSGTPGTDAYTLAAGTLPPGLSINSTSGIISGTPSAAGTYSFTVRLTDTGPTGVYKTNRQYSVTIASNVSTVAGNSGGDTTSSKSNAQDSQPVIIPAASDDSAATLPPANLDNFGNTSAEAFSISATSGQSFGFSFSAGSQTQNHTIIIDSISNNSVSVTLYSSPKHLQLAINQEQNVDLDNDGIPDVGVLASSVDSSKAIIKIWKLARPALAPPAATNSFVAKTSVHDSSKSWRLYLAAAVIALLILTVWFRRRVKRT